MLKTSKQLNIQEIENSYSGEGVTQTKHIIIGNELRKNSELFGKIILKKNASIGVHQHGNDFEVYYILKGKGILIENDEVMEVKGGDTIYTSNNQKHLIKNTGYDDLEFIAIVINDD